MSEMPDNLLTMSDEEFLRHAPAVLEAEASGSTDAGDVPDEPLENQPMVLEDRLNLAAQAAEAEQDAPEEENAAANEADGEAPSEDPAKPADAADQPAPVKEPGSQEAAQPADKTAPAADAEAQPDYEALYKQLMAPFKANGREFAPSSPEEAIKLMQMGANYTKKMQALKPNLKLMRMLENNGLLQEDKIAFLIDLDKKNPQAIQKLLHEGKVDPLDLDPSSEPTYTPGNHSVSDEQMNFHEAIETVAATPTGKDTIRHIDSTWDQVSKQVIFREPNLLQIIDDQRANGIYEKITTELERRKVLGEFQNVPFIQAYKTVGDDLHRQGRFAPNPGSAAAATAAVQTPVGSAPAPQAIETRPARSSKPAATRDQVRALTPAPGTSPKSAKASFNPFTMTDEEIMAIPTAF